MDAIFSKPSLKEILSAPIDARARPSDEYIIGRSRQGKPLYGFRFGNGALAVSLLGGCHADEPVGPWFLKHLVGFLGALSPQHPLLTNCTWVVIPDANPDGAEVNSVWWDNNRAAVDLARNLKGAVRELPGDDIEFGFPQEPKIEALRPENQYIYDFWKQQKVDFNLHASLHGMHRAYGPWFLLDRSFINEAPSLISNLQQLVLSKGYVLHDVDRGGEKGFNRIAEGFCTRPAGHAMRQYFQQIDDPHTAALFHASSMESIRSLSADCLTMVTEMPLFIVSGKPKELQWPDQNLEQWSNQFNSWRQLLLQGALSEQQVNDQAHSMGVKAMNIEEQMFFQWAYIWEGIKHQFTKI